MIFVIRYTFRAEATGRLLDNHTLIMADSAEAAKEAFFDSHYTTAGQHKVKSVEQFSTVELDTLI